MNEPHLILSCPRYEETRRELDIEAIVHDIVQQYGEGEGGYAVFWGKGMNLHVRHLQRRLECAMQLKDIYLKDVMALKPLYYRYR